MLFRVEHLSSTSCCYCATGLPLFVIALATVAMTSSSGGGGGGGSGMVVVRRKRSLALLLCPGQCCVCAADYEDRQLRRGACVARCHNFFRKGRIDSDSFPSGVKFRFTKEGVLYVGSCRCWPGNYLESFCLPQSVQRNFAAVTVRLQTC